MGTIGFIGAGSMAQAILKGIIQSSLYIPAQITLSAPDQGKLDALKSAYGVNVTTSNDEVAASCDVVIIAVKPQMATLVLSNLKVGKNQVFISIMAGMTTQRLEKFFSERVRFIRAMPNTSLSVGKGCTAVCSGSYAHEDDLELAKKIFSSAGYVVNVNEKQMDAVAAISGSGPAYFYLMIEALSDAGVNMGLSRTLALTLATQTAAGAAQMLTETGTHPAILKDMVTSPGGTTIAAIKVLEDKGVRSAFISAVEAATLKASNLD